MAAGVTLLAESFDAMREALVRYANAQIKPADLIRAITIDCEATLEELTVPLVHSLQQMQPFGRCNESPTILLRGVRVQEAKPFGDGSHVRVGFEGSRSRGVWFRPRDPSELLEMLPRKATIDVVVEPKLNKWRGVTSVDLHIKDLVRR
jgi:single-stranded-DNA-specific exonuclease